ncbi:MAG: hypothetical protein HKN47_28805, partial [Pirellulaceae bacterium]|nr:hypothetical protein [Pirellulaceae bacterium]
MNANSKIALAALLWMQAIFLGSTFRTWLPVVAATMLASFVVLAKHNNQDAKSDHEQQKPSRLTPSLRWLLVIASFVVILGVSLLWRFGGQSGTEINVLSVAVDSIAHWALFCSLLLWALLPNRGHVAMLGFGMLVLLFGVAGGGASRSMAAQTSISLAACVGFTLAAQIIVGANRGTSGLIFAGDESRDVGARWMGRTVSLITISLILMTTGVVANVTNQVLPDVQQAVQEQLQESLDVVVDRTGIGGTRYVRSGKIGAVHQHITANPTEISLYVKSKYSPGYLRGRVYDLYKKNRWYSTAKLDAPWPANASEYERRMAPVSEGRVKLEFPLARKLKRFPFPQEPENTPTPTTQTHVVVYNNPTKGYVVFTPLATQWIEANSREILIDDHDQIGMGVDVTKPYVAGVSIRPRRDRLSAEQVQQLTLVPPSLETEARRVAAEVIPTDGNVRQKAAAISRYFQSGSDYSLRPPA